MTLKDLEFDISYSSDIRDIGLLFYNPALSEAERYDRITAYFNSKSFIAAGTGLTEMISNGGKIRMILDTVTSKKDKKAIEGDVQEKIIEDVREIDDEVIEDHVSLLAWLIDEGRLELKIAKEESNGGIVHPKIGLLIDSEGNKLAFDGSVNETLSGWKGNIESLTIYKGWSEGQRPYVEEKEEVFKRFWWNESKGIEVYELEDALKQEILQYKPEDDEELEEKINRVKRYQRKEEGEELEPRYYQQEAIESWAGSEYRGIWEMATGTGKTLTSVWGLERLLEEKESVFTVVVCPFSHLIEQWREDLEENGFSCVSTQNRHWEEQIETELTHLSHGTQDTTVLLTTYYKYYRDDFKELIREVKADKLLIADEVHYAGAPTFSKGLLGDYDYRLGLSATPERYMDDEGTEIILDFFGDVVQEYGLEKAIEEGHLSPYNYHVKDVDLTDDEREDYLENTKKIASLMNQDDLSEDERERLETLLRNRSEILKKAEKKERAFRELIKQIDMEKTLVFCEDRDQLEMTEKVMDEERIMYAEFTQREDNEERRKRAQNLKEGKLDVLAAMGVLDEGFDLPAARQAIILSSTGNEAQYIQRRGRVLRVPKEEGEEDQTAEIHDFLVFPGEEDLDNLKDYEKSIIEKELKRFKNFAEIAENTEELENVFELDSKL